MTESKPPSDSDREAALHRVADRLTVICGFGELLRDGAYGSITPEQQRILDTLVKEAREAGNLFQQLLQKRDRKPAPPESS
ncbi:MAG TPA: hypothetical protein VKW04_21105 [Planctomycetota bacterium]|nr:hypothetical protein [Planctomycetota bacterium]